MHPSGSDRFLVGRLDGNGRRYTCFFFLALAFDVFSNGLLAHVPDTGNESPSRPKRSGIELETCCVSLFDNLLPFSAIHLNISVVHGENIITESARLVVEGRGF